MSLILEFSVWVHPSIFWCLSESRLSYQEANQSSPDLPLLRNSILQLLLEDPQVFSGQAGYISPSVCLSVQCSACFTSIYLSISCSILALFMNKTPRCTAVKCGSSFPFFDGLILPTSLMKQQGQKWNLVNLCRVDQHGCATVQWHVSVHACRPVV